MNNTTIYQQLQHHYQKLQTRLAKARNKGKSISFQERLLSRIQRCALQMKQLGAGVAVMAALGVATPVLGQNVTPLSYVEKTGVDNPFDTINSVLDIVYFEDLDGDTKKDMITVSTTNGSGGIFYKFDYRRNTGTASSPKFELQNNSTLLDNIDQYARGLSFVDIDNDGDKDLFTSDYVYYSGNTSASLSYYRNDGTSFTLMPSTSNPLQKVADYYNALNLNVPPIIYTHFMDVDNDGDQDCLVGAGYATFPAANNGDRFLYYENVAPAGNAPDFQLQPAANNPLDIINTTLPTGDELRERMYIFDGDSIRDGQLDIFVQASNSIGQTNSYYFKNTGTTGAPNFMYSTITPMDSILINYSLALSGLQGAVDLTNNGRTEFIGNASNGFRYFVDVVSVMNQLLLQGAQPLNVYPNPSKGIFQLEEAYTGQLEVYTTTGQLVYSQEVENIEQLDLQQLNTGIYIVSLQTDKERLVQQLTIIK